MSKPIYIVMYPLGFTVVPTLKGPKSVENCFVAESILKLIETDGIENIEKLVKTYYSKFQIQRINCTCE